MNSIQLRKLSSTTLANIKKIQDHYAISTNTGAVLHAVDTHWNLIDRNKQLQNELTDLKIKHQELLRNLTLFKEALDAQSVFTEKLRTGEFSKPQKSVSELINENQNF